MIETIAHGAFSLKRWVSDPLLTLVGIAKFEPYHLGLAFEERGEYLLNGQTQPFYQKRFFLFLDTTLQILKEDESLLHTFSLGDGKHIFNRELCHTHVCKEDLYKTTLVIKNPYTFTWHYNIVGPQKSQTVYSEYKQSI
jgi:hypothetical protein